MSVILALDTSAVSTGAAVAVDGRVASSSLVLKPRGHSENLFAQVEEVLKAAGVTKEQLTGVAVTNGPGSFTGLRVGLATAKGLAFGLGLKIAGVSTLAALREPHSDFKGFVAPLLDAKKGQVYASVYDSGGNLEVEEGAYGPEDFASRLLALKAPCLLVGSGLGPYRAIFERNAPWGHVYAHHDQWHVSPGAVAAIAARIFEAGHEVSSQRLGAVYLRKSEAEENWKTSGKAAI